MIIFFEIIIYCLLFTLMVYIMANDPIKTLYNYPPKIQERVKQIEQYKGKIPTNNDKIIAKLFFSFIMRYINCYNTFIDGFKYSFLIWTVINLYDAIVLDCIWFCHSKRFIFKGTEDMIKEYHNYWFHIKGFFIGEIIGLIICLIVGFLVTII